MADEPDTLRIRAARHGLQTTYAGGRSLSSPAAAFDRVAPAYRDLWTGTEIGRLQREAFWRYAFPLFRTDENILDLGCGTGEDALRFARSGIRVAGIDVSPEMVRIARERGVNARLLRIEDIRCLQPGFDGAISDFGALNCVKRLSDLREPLATLIRPGGYLAICVMGRFCLWETALNSVRGQFGKAIRRWKGTAFSSSGLAVFYPAVREIECALSPAFCLTGWAGIGVCVPPSYVRGLSGSRLRQLDRINRRIAALPFFRALADHRFLAFRRL